MPESFPFKTMWRFIPLILLFCFSTFAQSTEQSREQLEREKKRNLERIAEAERILGATQKKKKTSLGRLRNITHEINTRQKQLALIEADLNLIDEEVVELEKAIVDLENKLVRLKEEYADMLYVAAKPTSQLNKLSFLLSSRSLNDLIMRYKFLDQYTESRQIQLKQIQLITADLKTRQESLVGKKQEKSKSFVQKQNENSKLVQLKQEQNSVVKELSKEEQQLRSQIAASKKAVKRLDSVISSLITKGNATAKRDDASIDAFVKLSARFEDNRRKLPWPVSSGFISDKFGVKAHPVLKGVKIDNNGVDIRTSENATVSAVFEGTVMGVSQIPGLNNVVAVQHGDYYTVYTNLAQVQVNAGDKVKARQSLGTAATKDGDPTINFQVWHKFEKENPEKWLQRK